jgi:hypothetical protein
MFTPRVRAANLHRDHFGLRVIATLGHHLLRKQRQAAARRVRMQLLQDRDTQTDRRAVAAGEPVSRCNFDNPS